MSKGNSKYIATFDYFDNALTFLSATSGGMSIASFVTIIIVPLGKVSESFNYAFSITGIVKKLLETTRNKKKNHNKVIMLARSKLNSIESRISEALIDNLISHEEFTTILNEEKNYRELRGPIRVIKSQRSDIERNKQREDGKRTDIDEIIIQNERINNNL